MTRRFLVVALAVFLAVPVLAQESPVEEAARLRDESSTAWKEKRYADAVTLLRRADEIYEQEEGEFLDERAITLRALCWNQVLAGETEPARDTWIRLSALVRGRKTANSEVWSAYQALYDGAKASEEPGEYLAPIRKAAKKDGRDEIAAQVLHDTGYLLLEAGRAREAEKAYEAAIRERRKIGDDLGVVWSRTNLANLLLAEDRLTDALGELSEAFRAVRDEKNPVGPPQAALAKNLRDALGRIAKTEEPGKKVVDWLWWMATTASTDTPEIVPADVFYRAALAADPSPRAAEKVARVELPGRPEAVRADLVIRAARAAIGAGAARRARPWLDGLAIGESPTAPHLAARRDTVLALVSAALGEAERFRGEAETAAAAWRELGDFSGRQGALIELADAAKELGLDEPMADLIREADEVRRSGSPGGAGGSASSGGDRSGAKNLGPLDPLFAVTVENGRVRIRDLVASKDTAAAITWTPKPVGLNGLSLLLFGGYVKVRGLAYGGASVSEGAPGSMTLDELGEYFPLPEVGRLVILKNGAIDYRD
jgi:tetratricopeptide (TPR) repeat protein